MSTDVDDVGALCLAHRLADSGEASEREASDNKRTMK